MAEMLSVVNCASGLPGLDIVLREMASFVIVMAEGSLYCARGE